jgi:hypothetical protein
MTAITNQHAQSGQRMRAEFGPTHAMVLLPTGRHLVVGALDRATGVA